jgi:hypothetical protein
MEERWRSQRWVLVCILAFVLLTQLLLVILGIRYVTPLRLVRSPASGPRHEPTMVVEVTVMTTTPSPSDGRGTGTRQNDLAPRAEVNHGSLLLAFDPHDDLHMFVVLPALAGLVTLGGSAVAWAIRTRWRISAGRDAATAGRPGDKVAWLQFGLLGLLWWFALSLFLILDLAGSVSLYPGFIVVYALCWVPVGLVILHPRPLREKLLVVVLFAVVLLSIRSVHWNSRKPFLKDLDRVRMGTPVAQVDEFMDDYMKAIGTVTQVDGQGRIISGTITYRHTTEGWGNSDVGVLTIADGRVVDVEFLPD